MEEEKFLSSWKMARWRKYRFIPGFYIYSPKFHNRLKKCLNTTLCEYCSCKMWRMYIVLSKWYFGKIQCGFTLSRLYCRNENEKGWNMVLDFLVKQFSHLNNCSNTIITDKDKGLNGAMESEPFRIKPLHCTFHRAENIKKRNGSKVVALFWKLMQSKSVSKLM